MASKKNKARSARDLNPRKFKKKTSVLVIDKVEYIDYKDVDLLQRFMSDRAKIKNRRVAGNTLQQQREIANAVKVAREMALLPYAKRVASTRTGGRGRDGGREGGRDRDTGANDTGDLVMDDQILDDTEVTDGLATDDVLEHEEV
ncbi:MAG TPA: 30S ribosomal protein S18 [Ilumatobacteraceae bacterium]|nr:30S ribosomal protein S18 [Ilumatobacteraceae bacterium]